jgi:serine/threonine-protein kinase
LLSVIASGGRGDVYRARDRELQRDLAITVLLPRFVGRPDVARRFLAEAQVAAQLQHPGIVPVHEVGALPDGRPYFAMELVKGRTLAELLQERSSPAHDLPRFLGFFQQVCQAVAYAHSKGVIHRDLKPGNVMVGAFGEVQVMDWGLAKVLNAPTPPPSADAPATPPATSVVATVRSG